MNIQRSGPPAEHSWARCSSASKAAQPEKGSGAWGAGTRPHGCCVCTGSTFGYSHTGSNAPNYYFAFQKPKPALNVLLLYCGFDINLGCAVRAGHKLFPSALPGYFVLGPGAPVRGVLNCGAGGWGCAEDGYQPQAPALCGEARAAADQAWKFWLLQHSKSQAHTATAKSLVIWKTVQGFGDPNAVPWIAPFFCMPSVYSKQWRFRVAGPRNLTLFLFPCSPSHSARKQKHHSTQVFPKTECLSFRLQ